MKRLFVMRHGNSDWNDGLSDHERTLNPQGRHEAKNMAQNSFEK